MGFQHLSPEDLKRISSKGGKVGAGHRFTSDEAKAAGTKGATTRWNRRAKKVGTKDR